MKYSELTSNDNLRIVIIIIIIIINDDLNELLYI
jgi:hypothetical protein